MIMIRCEDGVDKEEGVVSCPTIWLLIFANEIELCAIYRVSQKKHSYKIFGLEIMLFTCLQTLWSGLRSSFTKWGTAPAFTTACKTTMSASR